MTSNKFGAPGARTDTASGRGSVTPDGQGGRRWRPLVAEPKSIAKAQLKRVIRRAIAWYVDPTFRSAVGEGIDGAVAEVNRRIDARLPEPGSDADYRILARNQRLLMEQVPALMTTLNDLGQAIAPSGGLAAASARMAELREQLNDIDRRMRGMSTATVRSDGAGSTHPTEPPASDAPAGSRFDYVGFERRFRGDSALVLAEQQKRYMTLMRGRGPVLDVGCGRGEFVGALNAEGIEAKGIDTDANAVAEAIALGRNVCQGDAIEILRTSPAGEYGAIVSFQVLEHMPLETMLEFLELCVQRLRPGGLFIGETPNPTSLIVLGTHFILDPTHIRPLHPDLLAFLCERAGFRTVGVRFFSPAVSYHLPLLVADDMPPWAASINDSLTRLNNVLFGPQDYAVVAETPPG